MDLKNNDLYKKHDQLIQLKKETYEKLYIRCKNVIKLTSNAGELICLFEIPEFVFGSSYPIINIVSCANYIMNKLTKANINIKAIFIEPNIIFIDWRRESDLDSRKNNTINSVHTHKSKMRSTDHRSSDLRTDSFSSNSNKKKH